MSFYRKPQVQMVTYKGKKYRCLWIGVTKTGKNMAKLGFFGSDASFWVDSSLVAAAPASNAPKKWECSFCGEDKVDGDDSCWECGLSYSCK